MKRKSLLIMLLVALFVPLAMNAQTQRLRKNVTRAPRPELQFEVAGQLQAIEDFQPGKVYHRATTNTRDNVLYSNGFEDGEYQTISIYDNDGDGYNWGIFGDGGVDDSYCAYSQSYVNNVGALTPDNWIIMPAVTLPAGNAQYFASIYAQSVGGYGETMGIYVAPENDDYIHQVGSDFNLSTGEYEFCEVDLSAYAGQTIEIYIRHYNCTNGWYLLVDNFSIYSRVAEEEITIGSGTNTNATVPTYTAARYSVSEQIYTSTEIGHTDGGNITSISFYGNRAATRNLDVYLVNTGQSTITTSTSIRPTASDKVYSGNVTFAANGWTKITFSTPFEYTGGNVAVIVDDNTNATTTAVNFLVFNATNQAIRYNGKTNYAPTNQISEWTALSNQKNQVKFTIQAAPTPVESITASDLSMMAGISAQIDYTVLPADATNPAVTFTSANTLVATVNASGLVTGVAAGTTTITLTSVSNPEVSTTINVVVDEFVGLIFDFETNPNEEGWTFVDSDGDGFNWVWEDCSETPHMTPMEGEGCLYSLSYDNDNNAALTPDNWAITPAIHILSSPSVVYLYAAGQDASYAAEHFQVYIGTSPDPASMTAISSEFVATGSYVQYSTNIPDTYAGQIVYLAIRHFNVTDMFALDVDYLIITNAELAPEQEPVQFTVNAPANAYVGHTITVEAVLTAPENYSGFTDLLMAINYDHTAFAFVNGSIVYGPVIAQAQQYNAQVTNITNVTDKIQVAINCFDEGYFVTADGIVFSAQFTVLEGAEGEYTFTAEPNGALNFDHEGVAISYEATPSTVTIAEQHTLPIIGYDTEAANGTLSWYLIASPIGTIANDNLEEKVTNIFSNSYDLYYFNQSGKQGDDYVEWINYKPGNGTYQATDYYFDLVRGKGYLYANSQTVDLVFNGFAPSTDDFEVTLAYDADARFKGWNLVGNPYAVPAYFTTDRDFYTMNSAGTSFEVCTDPERSIQPMQGVFVIAGSNEGSLFFTTSNPNTQGKGIVLKLKGRSNTDAAIVRFGEGRTLPKLQLFEGSTKIYIPQDGKEYAVVRSEEMGEMPVNFKAEENGTYSLNVGGQNTEFAYLHLIDNMTGADVDLLETPSYSFEAKTTDYASRFKLVFATGNASDDTFAFFSNGSFVINNEGNAELQVIDIMGRIVKSESINGCANVSVNGAAGVYMLRLVNGDNVKVQKVVVK